MSLFCCTALSTDFEEKKESKLRGEERLLIPAGHGVPAVFLRAEVKGDYRCDSCRERH